MDKTFALDPENERAIPLEQKRNARITGIKVKLVKKDKYILTITPVYENEKKPGRYLLTEFYLN